ncbi:hypothetical protein [uncultured Robinsoniella sp.]|uniref:hypothetical protein n=1 Tax=uncultured Robinsoniella sp. TaxID=904190 RepID=UPI00374E4A43
MLKCIMRPNKIQTREDEIKTFKSEMKFKTNLYENIMVYLLKNRFYIEAKKQVDDVKLSYNAITIVLTKLRLLNGKR